MPALWQLWPKTWAVLGVNDDHMLWPRPRHACTVAPYVEAMVRALNRTCSTRCRGGGPLRGDRSALRGGRGGMLGSGTLDGAALLVPALATETPGVVRRILPCSRADAHESDALRP